MSIPSEDELAAYLGQASLAKKLCLEHLKSTMCFHQI